MLAGLRATAVALALVLAPAAGWAATFTGPSGPVTPGSAFTITGMIGDDASVGFDLFVEMDAGLTLIGVTLPDDDMGAGSVETLDSSFGPLALPAGGTVLVQVSSTFGPSDPPGGAVTKVMLDFMAPSSASGPLSITFDGNWAFYSFDSQSRPIALNRPFGPIEVTIAPIPLPAAAPLLVTSLAGLGFLGARRRRAA